MEIIVFLSIVIAVVAVLTSIVLVRRVKKQIAEMTDALVDVKNGNGNRRILSATNELVSPLAYEINEIVVSYESRLSIVRQTEETNRQLSYVEQLRGQIDALCQTKKIGLQMELEHLPDVLSADKLLLERAIMNVINNAMDYSPQDSSIHISIIGGKQHLKITVTDAGPGFSQEDLLHAKEQFYMADHSRSSNMHFGMGLFITKSIVQQHGGQLDLSNSEKTGGAQVTISIPY